MNNKQPLHIKYRPRTLSDLVGNEAIKASLQSYADRKGGIPHSYLLTGPKGTGKTTVARILRLILNCREENFKEFNGGNTRGIDTIRAVIEDSQYPGFSSGPKVYFFDECHKLTNEAQNSLLKLLEEPPGHVFLILATTDPQNLLPTIRSRCTFYELKLLRTAEMKSLLDEVLKKEGFEEFPEHLIAKIIKVSNGCAREALTMLDTIIDVEDDDLCEQLISNHIPDDSEASIRELCQTLLNYGHDWQKLSSIIKSLEGQEPESIRCAILGYFNKVLLNTGNKKGALIMNYFSEPMIGNDSKAILTLACFMCSQEFQKG